MDNKNDWEELEAWDSQRAQEQKSRFGEYPQGFRKNKKIDKITKGMDISLKVIRGIFFTIIAFAFLVYVLYTMSLKVSPTGQIEDLYKVKVKIVSKNVDKNGSGTYTLELKNNKDINFTVVKHGQSLIDDFSDNCQKYYFNTWDSHKKELFTVKESYSDELLSYETYIEINNEEELKTGVDAINDLVEFCGNENFYPTWNMYLSYEGHRIYPYEQSNVSKEEALNKSLGKFHSFTNELQ